MSISAFARDILISVGAFATGAAAVYGVGSWRAELKGRAKQDLATRLGKTASRFEDLLEDLRSPTGTHWNKWESGIESIKPLHETYIQLMEGKWEAQILMSKGISELLQSIAVRYRQLRTAAEEHFFRLEHPERVPDTKEELVKERERILWIYGGPEDEKAKALKQQLKQLMAELRKEIGSRSVSCKFWNLVMSIWDGTLWDKLSQQ